MAPTPSHTSESRSDPHGGDPRSTRDPSEYANDLDRRYGRSRSFRLRRRWIAGIVGIAFAAVFGVWVVWAGFDGTSASVDTNDAGYVVHSDHSVTVTSEVSTAPGTKVDCAVEALDKSFDIVGWKVVHLPASSQQSNTYVTQLQTTHRGVTGLIDKCWLP